MVSCLLSNAHSGCVCFKPVQGTCRHALQASKTPSPSTHFGSTASKILISITPVLCWQIILCTHVEEKVHFGLDPECFGILWLQEVMEGNILQGKLWAMPGLL